MSEKIYEMVTDKICELLEKGEIPWHKPWKGSGKEPQNMVSKKPYRGINSFILSCLGSTPYWLSYKQCQEKGGNVRKGERGTPVIFWKWLEVDDKESGEKKRIPLLRYYTVFNASQCDGITIPDPEDDKQIDFEPLEHCEKVVESMPKRPTIRHDEQRAFYRPSTDHVNMPRPDTFSKEEFYYNVLFHELGHSTGHESRLGRKQAGEWSRFGDNAYSQEELVAEMTAAFLSAHCAIEMQTIENSAAYIKSWLKVLRNNKKLLISAAGQAQKASDFILGKTFEEAPA